MAKPIIEQKFSDCQRIIKRLWEHLNLGNCIFTDIGNNPKAISASHSFPNILSNATPKLMSRAELTDSAKNFRDSLIWKWGLIVAIAYFDAWMEELATIMHTAYPSLAIKAKSRKYNFKTPSFNVDFFTKDKAGLGLTFSLTDPLLKEFGKWKEARNCLVHKGGRVTTRFAVLCNPPPKVGQRVTLSFSEAREAFAAILRLVKEVQKQVRRHARTLR